MHSGRPRRFACDSNLGRLAKWLRLMGFDTRCLRDDSKDALMAEARSGRTVLTRRRALEGLPGIHVVVSDDVFAQLRELAASLQITGPGDVFSRCCRCNTLLVEAEPEEVRGLVPDHVLLTSVYFSRCSGCGRIYWRCTHHERVRDKISTIFKDRES